MSDNENELEYQGRIVELGKSRVREKGMENDLKPCPFCGQDQKISVSNRGEKHSQKCECGGSWLGLGVNLKEESEEAWNTRPIEDALRARIAELEIDVASLEYLDGEAEIGASEIVGQLKKASARIAELEAAHRWISVGDRLPDYPCECMVVSDYRGDRQVLICEWNGDWRTVGWVTYWMPLPEPPEAVK